MWVLLRPHDSEEPIMQAVKMIGLDIAKSVFQVHGVDAEGRVIVRPGVCYVGLVYKNLPNDPKGHACCAAQMFLNEGDGVVFRGANGPWKTGEDDFHLTPEAAKALLKKVLDTYAEKHKQSPKELFIHGQMSFRDDEWCAFENAAPGGTNVVGVRIKRTSGETKLFRDGD
jgi:hypothetical protein